MNIVLRIFVLSCLGVMTFSTGRAQGRVKEEALISRYSGNSKLQGSRRAYLVKMKPGAVFTGIEVLRQLSPSHYIVRAADSGWLAVRSEWWLPASDNWKLSPALLADSGEMPATIRKGGLITLTVAVTDATVFKMYLRTLGESVRVLEEYAGNEAEGGMGQGGPISRLLKLRCSRALFMEQILSNPELTFADLSESSARGEQVLNDMDLTANEVNLAHRQFPAIAGKGLTGAVREDRYDTADIDFRGRVLNTPLSSTLLSSHATMMATIIGGGGNSYYSGEGVAYRCTLASFNFNSLLPDADTVYRQYAISVQNHSYGSNIENYYGAEATAHDISARNNPSLLHVFSAGNSGDQSATSGQYAGISGMANLTGNYKMAKNILTVGSIDSFGVVSPLSSKGPAFDGRVKPELVAFGQDGSSGAAAIVSGISLLLQQAYQEQHGGQLPPSDLVKAVLLNSAEDVGPPGIDYSSGYGSVNAYRALNVLTAKQYFTGTLQEGETQSYPLTIPANVRTLTITLVWNDAAAMPNAYTALVNDLDLELQQPATGTTWLPWTLNSAALADSLQALPRRARDSLNNAEQISLDHPPAGDYIIHVKGYNIPGGVQPYSLAYRWDSLNTFQWAYPTASDNISPGKPNLLRWQTTFSGAATLEYSLDGGSHWKGLEAAADLSRNHYYWNVPDTMAAGLLRATIGGQSFYSDTFALSRPLSLSVGFNCPDSVFLFWNAGKGVASYQLYALGQQTLEPGPVVSSPDSTLLFAKSDQPSMYYAVAPLLPLGKMGAKSYTINYTQQGVACYFQRFTADPQTGSEALLNLALGTLYRVNDITFEKQVGSGFQPLAQVAPTDELTYSAADETLSQGVNTYRVKIMLLDGRNFYSEEEQVNYLAGKSYILYPNPLNGQSILNILSADPAAAVWQLFNTLGQKVYEVRLSGSPQQVLVGRLARGLYFFSIRTTEGKKVESGKIVIN